MTRSAPRPEPRMREWVSVAEAARAADRDVSQIYRWIDQGKLATKHDDKGVTLVLAKAAMRVAGETRRGRPRATRLNA